MQRSGRGESPMARQLAVAPRRATRHNAAVKPWTWLLLGALASAPVVWLVAGRLHRFAYWTGPLLPAELQALATDGWQAEQLAVGDGVALAGLVRPPNAADARWILFAPGNSAGLLRGFRTVLDELCSGTDMGRMVFAYRGFDASGGTPDPQSLRADLLRQWQALRARGIAAERIEIWGHSLGSVLAVQLAADVVAGGETPRRLVLVAAAPRIAVMRFGTFGRFLPDDVFEVGEAPARVTCPTVIVHGELDTALPVEGVRDLATRFGERAVLHVVPGRGHLDLWGDARRIALPGAVAGK